MADGATPRGGVSALLRTTTASTMASDGGVGDSLEGLVTAVDELKRSMGMGEGVDLTAIEQFIARLRQENEEFRQYAEQAILSAQALKEERDELAHQLEQVKLEQTMGAALAETQKLKDVADEFERDLYQQKLAEAEARVAEAEVLRERITELEDENAGLNQTLKELRQTTRQLQSLQSHEVRRLQAVEKDAAGRAPAQASSVGAPAASAAEEVAASSAAPPSDGSYSPVAVSTGSAPGSTRRSFSGSPRSAVPVAVPAAPATEPSAAGAAAVRLAVQLEDVVGGADSGLLAEAAVALRTLAKRDAELAASQQEAARLRSEVDELNDTMFSKTFKPPSAWAEREIKYKQEKKYWEEQQKELAARVAALAAERDALRGGSGTQQLEERIQELEAALVQSQRERDGARAQLHELQLSLRTEGEFGRAGKRLSPYKRPMGVDASEGREVAQMVGNIEHASATASPEAASVGTAAAQRLHTTETELAAVRAEVASLQRQLSEQRAVQVPASVQGELGLGPVAAAATVAAAAADIEARLKAAEQESEALRRRLGGEAAAAPPVASDTAADLKQAFSGGGSYHHGGDSAADAVAAAVAAEADMQVQELQARASGAEAAGDAEEAAALRQQAAALQALSQQARTAEEEAAALRVQLQELRPVQLQISALVAAAGGEASTDELACLPVPAALQGELGAEVSAAVIEAKAADLADRLADAQQEAGESRQQLKAAVAAEQVLQAAAQQRQVLQAQLAAAEQRGGGANSEEAEGLRRQLAAVQAQKEAAQKQLWQLTELQQQLQQSETERRQLAAQLRARQAGASEADAEPAELATLCAELAEAQQNSAALRSELAVLRAAAASKAPVRLALNVDGGSGHGGHAAPAERLAAAEAEAARLRRQLTDLQPIRMQLMLREDAACLATPGSDLAAVGPGSRGPRRSLDVLSSGPLSPVAEGNADMAVLAREGSASSMGAFSSEQARELSRERAAADAAWREHQKASDVPALLRAKAELETRCQLLESQIAKMQGELEKADATNAAFEDHLDSALQTGDVSVLSGLKESLAKGRHSLSKRMFKRKGVSPSKDVLKHTVHEMQDALTSSEEEKNALKRQLAKLSKKYQQVTQQQAHVAGIVEGAAAMQQQAELHSREASFSESPELALALAHDDDTELELLKMREENQMLMEHVVMVKVRHAEMEGEYLEAKRQLLRTREKNLQLARKLADVREAAERGEPLPFTPRQGVPTATATATVTTSTPGSAVSPLREGMAAAADAAVPAPKSGRKTGLVGLGIAGL